MIYFRQTHLMQAETIKMYIMKWYLKMVIMLITVHININQFNCYSQIFKWILLKYLRSRHLMLLHMHSHSGSGAGFTDNKVYLSNYNLKSLFIILEKTRRKLIKFCWKVDKLITICHNSLIYQSQIVTTVTR